MGNGLRLCVSARDIGRKGSWQFAVISRQWKILISANWRELAAGLEWAVGSGQSAVSRIWGILNCAVAAWREKELSLECLLIHFFNPEERRSPASPVFLHCISEIQGPIHIRLKFVFQS